jgi:hypothetical protein
MVFKVMHRRLITVVIVIIGVTIKSGILTGHSTFHCAEEAERLYDSLNGSVTIHKKTPHF